MHVAGTRPRGRPAKRGFWFVAVIDSSDLVPRGEFARAVDGAHSANAEQAPPLSWNLRALPGLKRPTSPSVKRHTSRRLFPESRYPAVLLPESFRGGCSFGGVPRGTWDALSCRVPAPSGAQTFLPRFTCEGKRAAKPYAARPGATARRTPENAPTMAPLLRRKINMVNLRALPSHLRKNAGRCGIFAL